MADPLATAADVEARFRGLTDPETALATALLADASDMLRSLVPSVDERVAAGTLSASLVTGAVARAVIRVLRNPDGKVSESIDDYTYRRADAVADGSLYIDPADLALLAPAGAVAATGAFTIRPWGRS